MQQTESLLAHDHESLVHQTRVNAANALAQYLLVFRHRSMNGERLKAIIRHDAKELTGIEAANSIGTSGQNFSKYWSVYREAKNSFLELTDCISKKDSALYFSMTAADIAEHRDQLELMAKARDQEKMQFELLEKPNSILCIVAGYSELFEELGEAPHIREYLESNDVCEKHLGISFSAMMPMVQGRLLDKIENVLAAAGM